jgi:CRISPR-associated protein Csd2
MEFVVLTEARDSGGNGDPVDNGPRIDDATLQALMTDVCFKRQPRDFVAIAVENGVLPPDRYGIYVARGEVLSLMRGQAYEEAQVTHEEYKKAKGKEKQAILRDKLIPAVCRLFWDIRMFGSVMDMSLNNCGKVTGPIQVTFGRTIDPVSIYEADITRCAIEKESDKFKKIKGEDGERLAESTFGRKSTIAYGLFETRGFVNPTLAKRTGVDVKDMEVLWDAISNSWVHTRSASRGFMATRAIYVWVHKSPLGNAPAHVLFDTVQTKKRDGIVSPRSWDDYETIVDTDAIKAASADVSLIRIKDGQVTKLV